MNRRKMLLSVVLSLAVGLALVGVVLAQTGNGYNLTWWTVDGGGGKVTGSGYTLVGTGGQPEAGQALTGGGYTLIGGFWPGAAAAGYEIYLPLVLR